MRPGQNKRMRGRNRRGPNPLTRSYESNGPDVKVRGTAQHIAEKYTQLARDAHVSGDPVMAESYLQHAEHYYRLIAAAHQAQQALANGTADDRDDEDDDFDTANDRFTFRSVQSQPQNGNQPQPERPESAEGAEPAEGEDGGQERPGGERMFGDRQQNRNDRHNRDNRDRNRNQDRFRQGGDRDRNRERFDPNRPRRPQPDLEGAEQPVLPAFLTAPAARAIPIEVPGSAEGGEAPAAPPPGAEEHESARSPFRTRRRRRPREEGGDAPVAAEQD